MLCFKSIRAPVLVALCLWAGSLSAAIAVDINSGNPRYPFPQFLDYGAGRASLASHNPEGVPHAEMEQRTRDAWQIFANQFTTTGTTWAGVDYIKANTGCPYDCTEGDGYALIAAAYMGDKKLYDGIWFRFHDLRMQKRPRYSDGVVPNAAYDYGNTPSDGSGDSAADGDFDAALGVLMAWYQWGDLQGSLAFNGTPISYKDEALYLINAIVEKARRFPLADCRTTTGDIGYDGYVKGGNTFKEVTDWATGCPNPQYNGTDGPEYAGPIATHVDYYAPAYFSCFASFLSSQAQPAFNILQYQRAAASGDWVMGQMSAQGLIPDAGWYTVTGTTAGFSAFNAGEDFRLPWRTVLNYVWNGNPATTWNPTTHLPVAGANTFEQTIGTTMANFLKLPQALGQPCMSPGSAPITFQGPATVLQNYSPTGAPGPNFTLNWLHGTGAPSAIAAQDYDLMAQMFRQCVIEWDGNAGYLTSTPGYFHGFFRWLGMDILAGNHPDPCDLVAPGAGSVPSNLKIYKSVDKTYAFTGDTVTYWLNYRNYSSSTATGVSISDALPPELGFVSASPAATSAPAVGSSGTVTWSRPNLSGLVNQNYAATQSGVTLVAKVLGASGRVCNAASISTSNGSGWTSNEYPNDKTDVMQRNCVDIIPAALSLTKTASTNMANPGDTVTFSIAYGNNPTPWLNGGRPGVNVAFAVAAAPSTTSTLTWQVRLYHAADEAYINYKNYRISYFLYDPSYAAGSWTFGAAGLPTTYEGGAASGVNVTQQNLVSGTAAAGKWNQRVIVQFADQQATIASHLWNYYGMAARIHEGGLQPLRGVWDMHLLSYAATNWADDWSADPAAVQADSGAYFPITNDWTDPLNPNLPVTKVDKDACNAATHTVNNVLVEEWDGYTWRRAFGNGPVSGREMSNVQIVDTIPAGMSFGGWVGTPGTQVGNVLTWTIPLLRLNETGTVGYAAVVANAAAFGGCPVSTSITNTAKISATNESPLFSSASVNITCNALPTPVPAFNKSGPAGPVAVGANAAYVIAYNAPSPLGLVQDTFSSNTIANWTSQQGAAWGIAGGVMTPAGWGGATMTLNGSSAADSTVIAHLSVPNYADGGVVFRATAANTYYYVQVHATNNGQSQVFFKKSVGGTVTTIQSTAANLAIPSATFIGVKIVATGNSFDISVDSGSGYANPFGGPITDSSIAGPGVAGVRTENDPGVQATDISATLDRINGVSIWDTTPASTDFQSGSPAPAVAPAVGGTGLVRWDLGTVIAGTTYSVTLTVRVASCPGPGYVVNTATLVGPGVVSNPVTTTVSCGGTPTFTPAMTPTRTASPSATRTASPSPSATPTASPSRTASVTATPSWSPSATPTASPSRTAIPTATPSRSPSPTWTITFLDTYTVSPTITLTATPSGTRTQSPSGTPTWSPSATPTASPSRTASPTATPTWSPSPTHTPVASATHTPSISPTASNTPIYSPTATPTASPTSTATPSFTATPSGTPTATPSATRTHSATLTGTPTRTDTSTATPSRTATATFSSTPTQSATLTASPTRTDTPTITPTPSISPTFTESPTRVVQFYQQPELIRERGVYPNPFSDKVRLFFSLRVDAVARLTIYNVAGEPIFSLERSAKAGSNELIWEGLNELGARCSSGVYLINLRAEGMDKSTGGYWTSVVIVR